MSDEFITLGVLRDDLELIGGENFSSKLNKWIVHDPLRNTYTEIDEVSFEILCNWKPRARITFLIDALSDEGLEVTNDEILDFIRLAESLDWFVCETAEELASLRSRFVNNKKSLSHRIMHGYLFFKIPIVHPEPWIEKISQSLSFLQHQFLSFMFFCLTLWGVISVYEDWDNFISTFSGLLTINGYLTYGLCFVFLKILHECGHAITAKWRGVKIGSMGVAFLVMFPVLYTDTSDSWRLRNKSDRLSIVLAGLKVEIYLGVLALCVWSIVPPGEVKTICFVLATTAILSSIFTNLSPFMRFDGYFALSDFFNFPNLQPRSFELALWSIRKFIFGLNDRRPENKSNVVLVSLIFYAFAVWVYRFFLFAAIAYLVYSISFKVLGIFLFFVEIWFFILRPFLREMLKIVKRWRNFSLTRTSGLSFIIFSISVCFVFLPLNRTDSYPAVISNSVLKIFSPQSGAVDRSIKVVKSVRKGDVLVHIRPLDLDFKAKSLDIRISHIKNKIRLTAVTGEFSKFHQYQEKLTSLKTELEELKKIEESLIIRSEFDGTWVPNDSLVEGAFWNSDLPLGYLVESKNSDVITFVEPDKFQKMIFNKDIYFISDLGDLISVGVFGGFQPISDDVLHYELLSTNHSGSLPTRNINDLSYLDRPYYQLRFSTEHKVSIQHRGYIFIPGKASNILGGWIDIIIKTIKVELEFI